MILETAPHNIRNALLGKGLKAGFTDPPSDFKIQRSALIYKALRRYVSNIFLKNRASNYAALRDLMPHLLETFDILAERKMNKKGRPMKTIVAAMAGALVLAACGGGGGNDSSGAAPPVAQAQSKPVLIEWYGDSTTRGSTLVNGQYIQAPNNEPTTVQYLLQQKFGGIVTVSNQGLGGTTAAELLAGTDGVHPPWAEQMAQSKAQEVVINYGINDAYEQNYSPQQFYSDLNQIVSIAINAGKMVILETPNPINTDHDARLWYFQNMATGVGQTWNIPVIGQWLTLVALPNWPSLLSDNIHPTDNGYEIKAQNSFPVIAQTISNILQK